MSGFDFDALRDPDAPIPGGRDRDAVKERARRLRTRQLRTRVMVSSTALVIAAGAVLGVVALQNDTAPKVIVEGGGTSTTLPTTTATTEPRVTSSDSAESSSWVTPRHGWVLDQNGQVDETTDGGATWHARGRVEVRGSGARIRFIGGQDGFVFDAASGSPDLMITHDAGATWSSVSTPFSAVSDLAIAGSTIYVVAIPPQNTGTFGIWSTPTAHLVWKRDPRSLQIGAGPIPDEQIVLAGGAGWILNEDRTVVSGAQLGSTGSWASWNPPCLTLNGPANLTASTATDLVAVCSEHDFGGGPVTSGVYFSHDGGSSFTRHDAPGFGPIASPSSTTALLSTSGGIQRSTDDGATWHSVFASADGSVVNDIGFTTPTQGFAIFQNGLMLMTFDAGATWQKVTLP